MTTNENQMVLTDKREQRSSDQRIDHILQLNDDCLIELFRYFSLIELCDLSETCKRFQYITRTSFIRRGKSYRMPDNKINFNDHPRILRNFGDCLHEAKIYNFADVGIKKMKAAFNWLERYCANTLQALFIVHDKDFVFPESALRLIAKMKSVKLVVFSFEKARTLLQECKALVELDMMAYNGPFHLANLYFPNLRILTHSSNVNSTSQFREIEAFFEKHPKLTDLSTSFHTEGECSVDLSFICHLKDLEKLYLISEGAPLTGIESLTCLKKLTEFSFDNNNHAVAIFESIASCDIKKLKLGFPKFDHLIANIGQYQNLSKLEIVGMLLGRSFKTNISCLAQLRNSRLTELIIECSALLQPNTIVNVVSNLRELKVLTLFCKVELTEAICKRLVAVCSFQSRMLKINICRSAMTLFGLNFGFIDKFNEQHGKFVFIKDNE